MNRLLASGLLAALVSGTPASLAAEDSSAGAESRAESRLSGKAVVVKGEGRPTNVWVNVRFAIIGENSFMIVAHPSAKQRDQWISLDEINDIEVFDTVDEAVSYIDDVVPDKSPQPGLATPKTGDAAEHRVHIAGDRIIFNDKKITLATLAKALSELPPNSRTVLVTGSPGTTSQQIQSVIRLINESGRGALSSVEVKTEVDEFVLESPVRPVGEKGKPSIAGTVTHRGQPVTGRIFFHSSDGTFFGSQISDDGKYAFPNPPQGEFKVTVEGPNVPEQYSNRKSKDKVTINSGSNAVDIDL